MAATQPGSSRAPSHLGPLALTMALALTGPARAADPSEAALALTTSRPSARTNQPITFTAVVTSTAAGPVPAGEVTFLDGAAVLGVRPLADGAASLTVRSLPRGTHAIAARYAGDDALLPTEGALAAGQEVADTAPVAGAGQAVTFDGLVQHARVEDPEGALDGAQTVELWFEAAPGPAAGTACLVQQGEGGSVRLGLCLSPARDRLVVRRGFETTFIPVAVGPGWHHLALSAGPVEAQVYLDGEAFTPLLGALRPGGRQPLVIGGAPLGDGATDRFAGAVDELRLWSTARTAAELAASARQPVQGDAPGLLALWRMDEGVGDALFDAGPAHLPAALAAPGPATWGPSAAWRRRAITSPRRLAPFLAGYDADGDPFATRVAVAARHGHAAPDGAEAGYLPAPDFTGLDAFTCEVAGGGATSRYLTEVEVPAPLPCLDDAGCGGGDLCVAGACVAPARLVVTGGGASCSSGGGAPGAWLALLGAALLGLARRRG